MAKKPAKPAPAPGTKPADFFSWKRVAFVGDLGYKMAEKCEEWLTQRNATVVPPTEKMSVLVYGEGHRGKMPSEVVKIQDQLPDVEVMSLAEFAAALLPDDATFAEQLRAGGERDWRYWSALESFIRHAHDAGKTLDLSGVDLRSANLYGARLEQVALVGADFRDADLRSAQFTFDAPGLDRVKFDRAQLYAATIRHAIRCSFRKANLDQMRGDNATFEACDFRDSVLTRFRGERTKFTGCDFRIANLGDAQLDETHFTGCDLSGATLKHVHAKGAQFTDCKFGKANLQRAFLARGSLKNADLRGADLSNADLTGADLTGAQVAGANFSSTTLTGATIQGVDFTKAKNFTPPVPVVPGPKVTEFDIVAKGGKQFVTSAEIELGPGEHASLSIEFWVRGTHSGLSSTSRYFRDGKEAYDLIDGSTLIEALANMAGRWPNTTLRLDSITAKGSKILRGAKLQSLAVAAWAEAFGVPQNTEEDLAAQKSAQADAALQARDELLARVRAEGTSAWRALEHRERHRLDLRGADFNGADLRGEACREFDVGINQDCTGSTFVRAKLPNARLYCGNFKGADFTDADLTNVSLLHCEQAIFVRAKLTNADFTRAKLQGADFTDATLTGAKFEKAQFDEDTKFPKGFKIPDEMVWKGKGPRPGLRVTTTAAGSMTFDALVKGLPKKVEAGRIQKAKAMLKAEKFQLYADVTDTHLVGVVKSQSSKELVYSCRLASDGSFCCGTQNLKPCGGLSGELCKHLLVLILGLAKADQLDPATAANWVNASKAKQPVLDKDALSETFLKYKGAVAGEIDWRPTETTPEDFYTM